jgi:hypothetical protein
MTHPHQRQQPSVNFALQLVELLLAVLLLDGDCGSSAFIVKCDAEVLTKIWLPIEAYLLHVGRHIRYDIDGMRVLLVHGLLSCYGDRHFPSRVR